MKKTHLSILLGVISSIILIGAITWVYPSNDDLWVENPFWNGLSELYIQTQPTRISNMNMIESVNATDSTLFIIGPSLDFSPETSRIIIDYISRGGGLVLLDDFGTANKLLEALSIDVRFTGELLRDPIYREKNSLMPKVEVKNITGVNRIVLNYPTTLTQSTNTQVLAYSSPLSYVTVSQTDPPLDFYQSPIITRVRMGEGWVILVSDSSIFINSMIHKEDNQALLEYLARGTVLIDEVHTQRSPLTYIKETLSTYVKSLEYYEVRYLFVLLVTAGIMVPRKNGTNKTRDEVDELLIKHPEYDREELEWLQREKEKARSNN
ncbi:DUF4350 domain-containing protein [Candidatus Bathyarchaeota archaeon]|nr:MAG: DUF4350 domain-containing protein [Candidatus Bathyarchaeota archaeon]